MRALALALVCALALMLATLVNAALPARAAYAGEVTFSTVKIEANANTDGSLHVVEQRVFDLSGELGALVWELDGLPEGASLEVAGVRMAPVDASGAVTGEWVTLPETSFALGWRGAAADSPTGNAGNAGGSDAGNAGAAGGSDASATGATGAAGTTVTGVGPGRDTFAIDTPNNALYVFSAWADTRAIIEIDYTLVAGIQVYEDMAQINWRYVTEAWGIDAANVSLSIALPLPSGVAAVSGDNVLAWGHGPAEGELKVGADGVVSYVVPLVEAGRYAEARVLFPVSWLTNLSEQAKSARIVENIRDAAIAEESGWTDGAAFWRTWDAGVVATSAGLSALALLLGALVFAVRGRSRAVQAGEGERAVAVIGATVDASAVEPTATAELSATAEPIEPIEPLEPAVAGRLLRWNEEDLHDLTATVVHLVRAGVLHVEHEASAQGEDAADALGYRLTIDDAAAAQLKSPIEVASLELLFNKLAQGADALSLKQVVECAEKNPAAFVDAIDAWQKLLTQEVARQGLFDKKSLFAQKLLGAELVLVLLIGGGATAALGNVVPVAFALPTAIALGIMANYVPRRSKDGAKLVVRYEAQAPAVAPANERGSFADALDAVLEHTFAHAQTAAAQDRVDTSNKGSFGGTYINKN